MEGHQNLALIGPASFTIAVKLLPIARNNHDQCTSGFCLLRVSGFRVLWFGFMRQKMATSLIFLELCGTQAWR
jgi:hypothetical protein